MHVTGIFLVSLIQPGKQLEIFILNKALEKRIAYVLESITKDAKEIFSKYLVERSSVFKEAREFVSQYDVLVFTKR